MKLRLSFSLLLLFAAGAAYGQNGCVDSPECPTVVLAAAGGAAIAVVRRFRR